MNTINRYLPFEKKTEKMKLVATLLIAVLSFGLCAQETPSNNKEEKQYIPTEGFAGVGMNISGIINNIGVSAAIDPIGSDVLLGKYYLTDKIVFRTGLGINSLNYKGNSTDSVGSSQVNIDSSFSQTALYLSPGVEYHFLDDKRLDPYIGLSLSMGLISKPKYQTKNSIIDTTGTLDIESNYQSEGGFVFGGTAVVGFNYFIARNFALGAEYHLGVFHARAGGDWELVTVVTTDSGTSSSSRKTGANRAAVTTVDLSSQLNITLSYFFNIKG